MVTIAQAAEATKAANDLIHDAAQFGFLAQLVLVLIFLGAAGLSLYVWRVVLPERDARIKQMERHADAAMENSTSLALISKSLEQITRCVDSLPCRLGTPR